MKRTRVFLLCLTVTTLAGCAPLLGSKQPTDVFTLDSPAATRSSPAAAHRTDTGLAVQVPAAIGLLDTSAMLVSPASGELRVYAGARWADRPARLLHQRLLSALARAGATRAIPSDSNALTPYSVESDLDDFRALVGDGAPRVRVVLQVRLIDNDSRQLLAQRRFATEQAAGGNTAPAFASALGQASSTLADDVASWTLQQLPRTPAAAGR